MTPFQEYPKWIKDKDGKEHIVQNKQEEQQLTSGKPKPPEKEKDKPKA